MAGSPVAIDGPDAGRPSPPAGRSLCVTGATGTLGRAFARVCGARGWPHRLLSRRDMDIAAPASVAAALDTLTPWAVVNTAGYVRVDDAEGEPERCFRENATGPATLAGACAARGIALVTFSSDLVFDGRKGAPYVEGDAVNPLNVYGRSKAEAEARVLDVHPGALVVRTSAFFGPWDEYNFVTAVLRALAAGEPFRAASDAVVSPTYVPDLVGACLDLLAAERTGLVHVATAGAVTWADLARRAAAAASVPDPGLQAVRTDALHLRAPRPSYSALASERGGSLPPLADALARFVGERRPGGAEPPAAARAS
jgi:dTDP-4-dehydrorhamnose reductase